MDSQQDPTVAKGTRPDYFLEGAEDRFGESLRYERERRGMTQADVARALREMSGINLHPSAIAKMEQRTVEKPRSIRLEEAYGIAQVFQTTVDKMVSIRSELEDVAIEFEQLASLVRHVQIQETEAFNRLREFGPFMRSGMDDAPLELKTARIRIVRALAEVQEWQERNLEAHMNAERLLAEVMADPSDSGQEGEETN